MIPLGQRSVEKTSVRRRKNKQIGLISLLEKVFLEEFSRIK
jgi:hypothetical protein